MFQTDWEGLSENEKKNRSMISDYNDKIKRELSTLQKSKWVFSNVIKCFYKILITFKMAGY